MTPDSIVTPILNAEVGAVEARADDDLVALGPHPLDGAQGDIRVDQFNRGWIKVDSELHLDNDRSLP